MTLYSIPPAIGAASSFSIGLFVFIKNKKSLINISFALFCLSLSIWLFGYTITYSIKNANLAVFFCRLACTGAMFTAPTFYHLTISFLKLGGIKKEKRLVILFYGIMLAIAPFSMTSKYFLSGAYKYFWGYYSKAGLLHPVYLVIFFGIFIRGFFLLWRGYRKRKYLSHTEAVRIKYILAAYLIALTGSVDYIQKYGIEFYPFGFIFVSIFTFVVAYAIIRHRLMDINILAIKGLTYTLILILVGVISFGLMLGFDSVLSNLPNYNPVFSHFFILLLVVTTLIFSLPRLKLKTENAVTKVIFKDRYAYYDILREFAQRLTFILDENTLLDETVKTIAKTMVAPRVMLFLRDELSGDYLLKAASFHQEGKEKEKIILSSESYCIGLLIEKKKGLLKEELEEAISLGQLKIQKEQLEKIDFSIYIPLFIENTLLGILVLGERIKDRMYSDLDIVTLESLANQLALSISYKRLESQMARADRLVSLGTMAAGMAHEIRNPLSSIQTFAQLLPDKYNDREFREEFSKIVASDTQRISRIIESVMALANPKPYIPAPCKINEALDETLFLIESELKKEGVKVTRHYAEQLPQINADKEQLQQTFLNILLNALKALPKENGTLTISTSKKLIPSVLSGQEEKYVQIEIKDNGIGIEKKLLEKIFEPFFTTRAEGTGLGLAIVHRIIEQHRGFIKVDSEVGKGTIFLINLPC